MGLEESLQLALHYLQTGTPGKCISACDEILADSPGLIQALYLRGCAAFEAGDTDNSVSDLEIVHDNHPEHLQAAYQLGRSLRATGRLEDALLPLQAAMGAKDLTVQAGYELAACLAGLRRRPEAIKQYQGLLETQPGNALIAANLASLLERENRLDEAAIWTDNALAIDSANETARMTRATLDRRIGSYPQAIQELRSLLPGINNPINLSIAWNQLGQCLDGQEDWDDAFDAFSESNRILRKHHTGTRPDPQGPHGLQTLARIREWLKKKPVVAWNEPATPDTGGIAFLVGFPRSGTTLLDRMLRSHPDIEVLEEKSLFSLLHQDWSEPGTLEALADVNEAQITDARNTYRREMNRHRLQPERALVIDKLPLNLAYLFLIQRLFPQAPIIFLQRHPLDVCISCFFQAFALEASMAYFLDLRQTARYYDAVMQVATLSVDQVGNPIHKLRYEDLVARPKDQLTALLNFLSLEWNDSMLQYPTQVSNETSSTPSYQQVSQPLYTRSIGKWRHYSKQLESGFSILEPWVRQFGYEEMDTTKRGE